MAPAVVALEEDKEELEVEVVDDLDARFNA